MDRRSEKRFLVRNEVPSVTVVLGVVGWELVIFLEFFLQIPLDGVFKSFIERCFWLPP